MEAAMPLRRSRCWKARAASKPPRLESATRLRTALSMPWCDPGSISGCSCCSFPDVLYIFILKANTTVARMVLALA